MAERISCGGDRLTSLVGLAAHLACQVHAGHVAIWTRGTWRIHDGLHYSGTQMIRLAGHSTLIGADIVMDKS
jgi:hypothetical protein